mgnify:CR=1 FL=1|tara:strand:+ start:1533 stop:1766 length:234 start_codon:yes stop_codon:yes gene_type:complete
MPPRKRSDDDDLVTVAEFLEVELYHAIAEHLGIRVSQLRQCRSLYPETFGKAARYVLKHTVTPECRTHVMHRLDSER